MTRLLLYAVTPADARCPAGLRTLLGTRVAVVHAEQDAEPPADREAVLAFGRTIERIAHDGPALPMRFGTTVADLQELRLLIAEHEEAWAARLEAVAGCCELIVHLDHTPAGAPRPAPGEQSGREYLLARAEAVHSGDAVRDEIRAVLRPWLREARSLTGAGSDRMAVLVPHAAADRARTHLERWAADRREIEVAVTGPWPPFSFCEAAA